MKKILALVLILVLAVPFVGCAPKPEAPAAPAVEEMVKVGVSLPTQREERWVRDEGYSKIIPEAVSGLFNRLSMSMDDVDKFIFPCFFNCR